jgi:hypothetical protein
MKDTKLAPFDEPRDGHQGDCAILGNLA